MRDDIYGGLKNAIEKGTPIQQAIESFVRAGYNRKDVMDAANKISPEMQGESQQAQQVRPLAQGQPTQRQQVQQTQPRTQGLQQQIPTRPVNQQYKPLTNRQGQKLVKHGSTVKIIILVISLLILIAGLVATIFFRTEITDFIVKLFS